MAENNQTNKYAYLSRLSTKELEAILRADAESPSAGNDEAISYILEVIEQREHEHPSGSFPDIDSSWKEFQTIYNTPEGAEQSLYPNEQEMDLNGMSTRPKPTQKRKFRSAILVAAIIILLVASLTIPVAGFGWKLDGGSIHLYYYGAAEKLLFSRCKYGRFRFIFLPNWVRTSPEP